jgi:hypothetical protein
MAGGMSEAGGRHSRVEGVRHQIGLFDDDQICFRPLTQPLPPKARMGCNTGQPIQFSEWRTPLLIATRELGTTCAVQRGLIQTGIPETL